MHICSFWDLSVGRSSCSDGKENSELSYPPVPSAKEGSGLGSLSASPRGSRSVISEVGFSHRAGQNTGKSSDSLLKSSTLSRKQFHTFSP